MLDKPILTLFLPQLLSLIPYKLCVRFGIVVVGEVADGGDNTYLIYQAGSKQHQQLPNLSPYLSNYRLEIVEDGQIQDILNRYYQLQLNGGFNASMSGIATSNTPAFNAFEANSVLEELLCTAIYKQASDIHVNPFCNDVCGIFIRKDGIMLHLFDIDTLTCNKLAVRLRDLSEMDLYHNKPASKSCYILVANNKYRLRISMHPTLHSTKITIRILSERPSSWQLQDLQFDEEDTQKLIYLTQINEGITLTVGPTGHGKSTTLHILLKQIAAHKSIITIEDPIEYNLATITQTQASDELSLDASLTSLLRHDPDVLMIGEIRDSLTAQLAVRASLTGHYLLSTMHAGSFTQAISRLSNLLVAHKQDQAELPAILKGMIWQRLLRRICLKCRKALCKDCNFTGYAGRILLGIVAVEGEIYQPMLIQQKAQRLLDSQITDLDELKRVLPAEFKEA